MPPPQDDAIVSFEDWTFDLHDVSLVQASPKQLELMAESAVTDPFEEVVAVPSLEDNAVKDLVQDDAHEPLARAVPSPMEEFLRELEAHPSHFECRSCRLDLKHKGSDISASKRAEFRRAEGGAKCQEQREKL